MSAPASLPIFGDAYLADTQHLTLEEHGAYFKLMLIAWRSPDCALPDNDRRIAQMLAIGAKKWATLKPVVMAFWQLSEIGWQQKRLLKEYLWVTQKAQLNSKAAEARWGRKALENIDTNYANAYPNADANGYAPPPPPIEEERTNANALDGKPSPAAENSIEPIDLKAVLFTTGVAYLTRNGTPEKNARSMLGKWRQQYGDGAVVDALHLAQSEACSDPIPMITRILEARHGNQVRQHGSNRPAQGKTGRQQAADMLRQRAAELRAGGPDGTILQIG